MNRKIKYAQIKKNSLLDGSLKQEKRFHKKWRVEWSIFSKQRKNVKVKHIES